MASACRLWCVDDDIRPGPEQRKAPLVSPAGHSNRRTSMMKMALVIALAVSFSAGSAIAACPDKSAANTGADTQQTAGISKDGTHAPLETPKAKDSAGKPAAKDGSTMPLAGAEGGGDKNLATSQQDIEAQQHGGKTAAAKADDSCND
ncbi:MULTISPECIES: hypothetical protein [unclassified Mesorhizobium]|uniref:hypothetical protein n=1 Tax=unclassified Mesorhizobium TaxID=325217 RepID=UPI001FEFD430|nr:MULTISPECIES: hypothetical protein [unclassified Mesorhizobium]